METTGAPLETESPLPLRSFARDQSVADEFHASVEALHVAQEKAAARARGETLRARLIVISLVSVAAILVANLAGHRPFGRRPAVAAPPVAIAPALTVAPPTATAAPQVGPVAAIAGPAVGAGLAAGPDRLADCNAAADEGRWATVVSACSAAFAAHAGDSGLAMRVAQAEHRRGHTAAAGTWAHKAIAIDPTLPEAYVIVAHAEIEAGNHGRAATAYRRYLILAPRGWHAAEARRALGSATSVAARSDATR
jgi:hypothetical protein